MTCHSSSDQISQLNVGQYFQWVFPILYCNISSFILIFTLECLLNVPFGKNTGHVYCIHILHLPEMLDVSYTKALRKHKSF